MSTPPDLGKFSLKSFERLDLAGGDAAASKSLTRELEAEIARRVFGKGETGDLRALITELNELGHRFEPRKSSPGWTSFYEATNDGARAFHIHVEGGETPSAMVLYHETIDTTVARRRSAMSPRERAQADVEEEFARRGLALNTGEQPYRSMAPNDQIIACLHEMEGGVNNGGFDTYLLNTDGARIADAATFLEQIGAVKTAEIVRDVVALFPGRFGPAFRTSANVLVESKREALDALSSRFYSSRENIAVLAMRHASGGRKRKRGRSD